MKKAYGLGLLTVLFWSTSATAFKITLQYLDVLQLLLYAIITAIIILGSFLLISKRFMKVFRLKKKEYLFCMILGVMNPFLYYWMAVKAYDLLPAQIAQPINYTWVIMLTLLSVPLLKQSLGKVQIFATLTCYSGVVVLSYRSSAYSGPDINYFGIFLAFSCTIIWALYWIYNVQSHQDTIVNIFLNFIFSIPFIALACGLFSSFKVQDIRGLMGCAWIGSFELGFAFITWISALKLSHGTHKIANLIFLTPFISLIFIHMVLGEDIVLQTYIGLFLIIAGIFLEKYGQAIAEHNRCSP